MDITGRVVDVDANFDIKDEGGDDGVMEEGLTAVATLLLVPIVGSGLRVKLMSLFRPFARSRSGVGVDWRSRSSRTLARSRVRTSFSCE